MHRMLRRLHHVGLVVPDIGARIEAYARLGAKRVGEPFEVPGRNFLLAYVDLGNTLIELQQPLSPDTVSGRFLAANPCGGFNHAAYEVDDVLATRDWLVGEGGTVMGPPEGRRDHTGALVVVVDATQSHGTLIELREAVPAQSR
jgi:methylmalonyl-CoA/ethylmalonyl-CoA epimerase